MMPAFSIRMSRRGDSEVNFSAATLMEAKEVRSRGRWEILAEGLIFWRSAMAAVAFDSVREAM